MYYSSILYKKLKDDFGPNIINEQISYKSLIKKLNEKFNEDGVRIKHHRDSNSIDLIDPIYENKILDNDTFSFSGYFDPDVKNFPVTIHLHIERGKKYVNFTDKNYSGFIFGFSQTVQHEMIHYSQYTFRPEEVERLVEVYQYRKLDKKRKRAINYLREWSEIEAYAHDIAMELNYFYRDAVINDKYNLFKNIDELDELVTYNYYKSTFEGTKWYKVKRALIIKVWRWLPYANVPKFI